MKDRLNAKPQYSFLDLFVIYPSFLLLLLISSCSKKVEIAGNKMSDKVTAPPTIYHSQKVCSQFTIVKPKVDFLFLWDNTSSANFINAQTKAALQNTINLISARFNYHILLAPLKDDSSSAQLSLMVENTEMLSSSAKSLIVANDNQKKLEAFSKISGVQGTKEKGFEQVIKLISTNRANGIFRDNVYTIVVLMSTGDDNGYADSSQYSAVGAQIYFNQQKEEIQKQIQSMQSEHFRFISIVPHSNSSNPSSPCPKEGFKQGNQYRDMSTHFYNDLSSDYKTSFDSNIKDSYDICSTNFTHIFDGLNQTLQDVVVKHVYQYWPVATTQDPNFDPKKIQVWKNTRQDALIEDDPNGFRYVGFRKSWPTRIAPSTGEPFTGYMVELLGSGKVTFPECVLIKTQEPADYYGFIALDRNPNADTVELDINGKRIPQDPVNGWTLIGHHESKNIKVKSRTDTSPQEPGEYKSGYFLQLNGNAIYTNSDEVNFSFRAAPL